MSESFTPPRDCSLCPRLSAFRDQNRIQFPDRFNGAVPGFGPKDSELLIVGLAPGLKGANFTGRPFTADYAGILLYNTLIKFGFAQGQYDARPDDGLEMTGARITNAVHCVPPQNKPTPAEIKTCLTYLEQEIPAMPNLKIILALGRIAHEAVVRISGLRLAEAEFAHGAIHPLPGGVRLIDSYHCSRYNTQTRRLTTDMFEDIFKKTRRMLDAPGV